MAGGLQQCTSSLSTSAEDGDREEGDDDSEPQQVIYTNAEYDDERPILSTQRSDSEVTRIQINLHLAIPLKRKSPLIMSDLPRHSERSPSRVT